MKTKCFIINYNRITLTSKLADWCSAHDLEVIIIDNASTYPPLAEYYKNCGYKVLRSDYNFGHMVLWYDGIINSIKDKFILTDPDLDLSGVPDDFLDVMNRGLRKYPSFSKIGLSLEINDLQGTPFEAWEKKFWEKPLDKMYFEADVDTTFSLNIPSAFTYKSLRTNRPYTARHIPWYYTDMSLLPEDERYYIEPANKSFSWKNKIIN